MLPDEKSNIKCSKEVVYDNCIYKALITKMKEKTENENGCTVPWVVNSTSICKKPKNVNTTFWIAWNRVTNQFNDCPVPCDTLIVTLGKSNYKLDPSLNNTSKWNMYFASKTQLVGEHQLYPALSLIAEIGGYTGLVRNVFWFMSLFFGVYVFNFTKWVFTIGNNNSKNEEQ